MSKEERARKWSELVAIVGRWTRGYPAYLVRSKMVSGSGVNDHTRVLVMKEDVGFLIRFIWDHTDTITKLRDENRRLKEEFELVSRDGKSVVVHAYDYLYRKYGRRVEDEAGVHWYVKPTLRTPSNCWQIGWAIRPGPRRGQRRKRVKGMTDIPGEVWDKFVTATAHLECPVCHRPFRNHTREEAIEHLKQDVKIELDIAPISKPLEELRKKTGGD